ncbi:hypothetical protein SKAU_G00234790 [Synaphobranchus kaupii]|uniref:Uncharacterized protein n=1 Tax=Synaphobranchus kaupii TaxID=118154 RepID=A0A9Q1F6H3_SYNKA|nr:hypothetical protein SKAU_G00234790 [Synaphobranchus kaupii]
MKLRTRAASPSLAPRDDEEQWLHVPAVCHYRKSQTLGLSIAVVLEFLGPPDPTLGITNRRLFCHSSSPYITTVQSYQSSSTLTQTRLEDTAPETEKNTVVEGGEVRFNGKGKKIRKPRTIYSSLQLQALNRRVSANPVPGAAGESRTRRFSGTYANTGQDLVSEQTIQVQEIDEARRRHN